MAPSPQERRLWRDEFLRRLYDASDGNVIALVPMGEIGQQMNLDADDLDTTVRWLEGEGLLSFETLGGGISITHEGIKKVEEEPVPVRADLSVVLTATEHRELERLVRELQGAIEEARPQLDPDQIAELQASLDSAAAQLRSPKPKRAIVKVALDTLQQNWRRVAGGIVISAVGSAAFAAILTLTGKW